MPFVTSIAYKASGLGWLDTLSYNKIQSNKF